MMGKRIQFSEGSGGVRIVISKDLDFEKLHDYYAYTVNL